jgi:hypothetical protein
MGNSGKYFIKTELHAGEIIHGERMFRPTFEAIIEPEQTLWYSLTTLERCSKRI